MRLVKNSKGKEVLTMEDEPKGKKVFPAGGIISTANIAQVQARRKAEAEAAKAKAADHAKA